MPPLLIIILIIILLILLVGSFFYLLKWLRGPSNAVGISNVVVSITPGQLTAGSPSKFNVTVTAFGYSDTPTPRNLSIELIDQDPVSNDVLDTYNTQIAGTPGIAPVPDPTGVSALYHWTFTHTFELWCDAECRVAGAEGHSGEADPEIFARFKLFHIWPHQEVDSAPVTIRCVPAE